MRIHVMTLDYRSDRRDHLQDQVSLYPEVELVFHGGPKSKHPCIALGDNMRAAIEDCYHEPYCIIMEDDHYSTAYFSTDRLMDFIREAGNLQADILLGGVERSLGVELVRHIGGPSYLLQVGNFVGTQLLVVFQRFYDKFLMMNSLLCPEDALSFNGSIKKLLAFPFLSYQADLASDFGRGDRHRYRFEANEEAINTHLKLLANGIH